MAALAADVSRFGTSVNPRSASIIAPSPEPHCRVVPRGEFHGMVQELFAVYCASFVTITVAVISQLTYVVTK